MNITWDIRPCLPPFDGYNITYKNLTNNKTVFIPGEDKTVHQIIGLVPYTNYSIAVCFYNKKQGTCLYSEEIIQTTNQSIPGKVSNLTAVGTDVNEIRVSWNEPIFPNGVITGYDLQSSCQLCSGYTYRTDINMTQYNIRGLEKHNFNYSVQVRARTAVGHGKWVENIATTKDTGKL